MVSAQSLDTFAHWADMVGRIQNGDESGMVDLYAAIAEGAWPRLSRVLDSQSIEDRLHEVLLIVAETIRHGGLRDPRRLMGFVRTVTRRRIAHHIRGEIFNRRHFVSVADLQRHAPMHESPEAETLRRERIEGIRHALRRLNARDREIVERFYLREQPREQICREMKLTGTQFRLYKSRALAKCFEMVHPQPGR